MKRAAVAAMLAALLLVAGCAGHPVQVKEEPKGPGAKESPAAAPGKPVVLKKPEKKKERLSQPAWRDEEGKLATAEPRWPQQPVEPPPPPPALAPEEKPAPPPAPPPTVKPAPVQAPVETPVEAKESAPPAKSGPAAPPPSPAPPEKSPRELLMEAKSELASGRLNEALEAAVKAREGLGQDREAALLEARVRFELDDAEAGLGLFEELIRRRIGGRELIDTYVRWAAEKGAFKRAIASLEALKNPDSPPDPDLNGPLGWLCYRAGDAKRALENFEALEGTPAYAQWAVYAAKLKLLASDAAGAKASAARAGHGADQAAMLLAEAQSMEGHATDAEEMLKKERNGGPAAEYAARIGLGLMRLAQGDATGAAAHFEAAAGLMPARPEAWTDLGVAKRAAADEPVAEVAFAKALEVAPDFLPALKNLAILKEKYQADYPAAVKLYARYLELSPGDKDVERWLKAAQRSSEEAK